MPDALTVSEPVDQQGERSWLELVESIQRGERSGMEELYRVFSRGVRFYLCRQLGPQDLDDRVHDTFLIVVQAISKGELREPERLMGFVRTVVRRQVAAQIDRSVQSRREQAELESSATVSDHRDTPEEAAILRQHEQVAENVLRSVSGRDREILTRFYLTEQTQQEICEDCPKRNFVALNHGLRRGSGNWGKRHSGGESLLRDSTLQEYYLAEELRLLE